MSRLELCVPRAIMFDWDNTLVDSWGTIHEALNFLMRAMDKPEWSIEETTSGSGSACAKPSRSFRRPLGGGARHLSRAVSGNPSGAADPAGGPRGDAASACGTGDLPRDRQQQDRRVAAARGRAARLVAICSAASSAPAMCQSTSRRRSGASGAGAERRRRPARRCGLSAIPQSISNAPVNSGCVPVLLGVAVTGAGICQFRAAADLRRSRPGCFASLEGLRFDAARPSS